VDGFGGGSTSINYSENDNKTEIRSCIPETGIESCSLTGSYSMSVTVNYSTDEAGSMTMQQQASGSYDTCGQVFSDFPVTGDNFAFNVVWGNEANCGATFMGDGNYGPLIPTSATERSMTYHEGCGPVAQNQCSGGGSRQASFDKSLVETLSDQWEPEDPLEKAMANLDGFDGDWNDTSGSYKDVTGWAASVRKSRWRIVHPPTGTCFLRVWLRSVFTPKSGGAPVIGSVAPYTWSGSGRPCYAVADKSPTDPANLIKGSAIDLAIPASEGTVRIEIVKWSYLPSYTPADGQPNGFPPEE
jgi:hypothetical protein